jgi:hypothetical protein
MFGLENRRESSAGERNLTGTSARHTDNKVPPGLLHRFGMEKDEAGILVLGVGR